MINYQESLKEYSDYISWSETPQKFIKEFCEWYQDNCRFYFDEVKHG